MFSEYPNTMSGVYKKHLKIKPLERRLMLDASLGALITSVVIPENTVNAAEQVIDNDVSVTGTTTDFDGENLIISTTGGAEDQLSIINEGTGAGQIGVSGTDITYEGTIIGSLTSDGVNGNNLQIDLNTNATKASIERLIENVTYQNTSNNPTVNRTINMSLGLYFSENISIGIAPENDAPVSGNNTGVTVGEGATIGISNTELSVTDGDHSAPSLTYTVTNSPLRGQLELTTNAGVAVTSFTQDDIDNGLLIYVHDGSGSTFDRFHYTVSDGTDTLPTSTFNITINQSNDAPTLTTNNASDVSLGFTATIGGTADDFGTQAGSYNPNTIFNTFQSLVDVNDTQFRLVFTTAATNPGDFPGQVLFESGGAGVGMGLYLNADNELTVHAGSATSTPRLTSPTSLEANTQYAVVLEISDSDNQIRLFYEEASNHDWFYQGRTSEITLNGFTNTDIVGTDQGGYGRPNSTGSFGGFNGTSSGTGVFQGTLDSNLIISRMPGTTPTVNNDLVVTDIDTTASNIVYTVTDVTDYGVLYRDGVALGLNDTFTQVDLNTGLITYDSVSAPPGPGFVDGFGFDVSDGTTTLSSTYTINVDTVNVAPVIYDEAVIYDDDFTGGASGWNHNTTTTNATWGEFLGRFNRNIDNTNDQDLFRTFSLSGTQEYVTLEFDFLEIDTWDNERFYIFVDDVRVSNDRLRWNVYERPADDSTAGTDVRVTELTNDDGYTDVGRDVYRDQFYHYALTIPTTASSIKIGFGTNLNSTNLNDESWGVDNVQISELRPVGTGDTRSIQIGETIRNAEIVTQIMAGDADIGQTLTYTITGGSGVGIFDIDPATGEIRVIDDSQIDFELGTTSYTLDIQVQDNGPGLLTDTQTLTIDILDAHENTRPYVPYQVLSFSEDATNGTSVGTPTFTDPEGDGIERWQIIDGNELGVFAIDSTTGEITIADNSNVNFENDNRYDVRLRAWDDNFLGLFYDRTIRINVTNVDNAPSLDPEFIGENSGVPNVVYSSVTGNFYRFVDSNANYATAKANAEAMMLNGTAGHLLTIESAAEKAFVRSIADQHLWLGISDATVEGEWRFTGGPNEGAQLWQGAGANVGGSSTNGFFSDWRGSHEPNNGTAYNGAVFYRNDGRWVDVPVTNNYRYMVEWEGKNVVNNDKYYLNYDTPADLNNGDVVGVVKGLDPEGDTLSYTITGGTGVGLFTIDPTNGNVIITDASSLDPLIDYTLTVRVTEDNGANQFAEKTVTIVLNENLSLDANNGHTAIEGQATVINPVTELAASDNDGVAADIIFDIDTFPVNGELQLTTNPGVGIIQFTLDDLNNNRVQYVHDGTETLTDSFTFNVTDGGQTLPLETFNITVTPVNDAPVINVNTGTIILEGGTATITDVMLDTLDIDNTDLQLTYTASNYVRGQIEVGGIAQNTFTQDDINNNRVVFRHNGDEGGTASFDLSLADTGGLTDTATFNLTVTAQNDASVITTNTGFSVLEGGTHTITTAELNVTDPDDSGTGITYSISDVTGGQVQLSTNPGIPVLSFTQADLASNRVRFIHDGDEGNASFDVDVADGLEHGATNDTATVNVTRIAVNDAPDITRNLTSSVNEGGITQIKNIVLNTTDPDNVAADLTYTITGEVNGQLELLSNLGVQITSFTQTQLDSGDIVFRHDGSSTTTASFDMQVSDGTLSSAVETFNLTVDNVNDPPVISTGPATTVVEGQNTAITTAQLDSLDPDNLPVTLTYTVTATTNGYVALSSDVATPITSFSQVDLDSGLIRFVHDGSETINASFDVSLSDGALTDTATVNLNVTPQNDQTTLVVNDGSPNLINFNDYTITPHEAGQDGAGGHGTSVTVSADGATIELGGNAWKKIDIPYTLTANTVLSFEFRTDAVAEIQGIGFDNDTSVGNGLFGYQIAGSQVWGGVDQSHRNYQIGDGWVRYDIPIGADYTGVISNLTFIQDNDTGVAATTEFRNVGFYESNQNLNMNEGGTFNITAAHITSVDVDDSGTGLTYTASNLSNGVVQVSGVTQTTFTQDDIDNNRVTFVHDGSDTLSAGFDISLADGLENGTTTDTGTFSIIVNPVNDDTVITTNSALTLAEGSSSTITTTHLNMSDGDNSPHDVVVNVTGVASNGFVARASAPTVAITSFTLAEIQNGDIQYVHGGNEITMDSFDFTVTDGTYTSGVQTFNVNLTPTNDAVAITTNTGTSVAEDGNVIITNAMLDTTDIDSPDSDITYTATGLTNGHIEVSGVVQNTFTQVDINNNDVVFVHDGSETTSAGFDISVIDTGADGAGASVATFSMTTVPTNDTPHNIHLDSTSVGERDSINTVIGSLSTSDVDLPGDTFTYSIIADPDGKFALVGDELILNGSLSWRDAEFHTVTIRTDDNTGGTFDRTFTIDVERALDGVTAPTDGNFGDVDRGLLDKDPVFDDTSHESLIQNFVAGEASKSNAYYGANNLGQLIRENTTFSIQDMLSETNTDVGGGSPNHQTEIDKVNISQDRLDKTLPVSDRYTKMVDFLRSTQDFGDDKPLAEVENNKPAEDDKDKTSIKNIEDEFDNVLTYHEQRINQLMEALQS